MYLQSKFGYCIITQALNIALCKQDGITDRRTDGQSDYLIPQQTFQDGGIKIHRLLILVYP